MLLFEHSDRDELRAFFSDMTEAETETELCSPLVSFIESSSHN